MKTFHARLGDYEAPVAEALGDLEAERVVARLWARDHTLWSPDPREISNRLGWLDSPRTMTGELERIDAFVDGVRADGFTHALLLGMGGSSLAPEVFRKTFGVAEGFLDLAVCDSTDPGAVQALTERFDPTRTLYLVATKSGGTVETLSFFHHFWSHTATAVGAERAGRHFVAITDPGSSLEVTARDLGFRETFLNDPEIGGRYSALSFFGLVPAALGGVDLPRLLATAGRAAADAGPDGPTGANRGAALGAILGELARLGRDKLTLVSPALLASFGEWAEQLVAESTGKNGMGIVPVVGEAVGPPRVYGPDRVFVALCLPEAPGPDLSALEAAGHPVIRLDLSGLYDLGEAFFTWEVATAVAGWRLGIHPFDQPDVESAKIRARTRVSAYRDEGVLPAPAPSLVEGEMRVFGVPRGATVAETFTAFVDATVAGGYIGFHAYLPPNAETDEALHRLAQGVRERTVRAVTVGYGPRFLHSTGQLHKGDGGAGRFVQFTADPARDLPIPDAPGARTAALTFGVLETAQALGDREALEEKHRAVLRIHLGTDPVEALRRLARALAGKDDSPAS